MYYKNDEEYVKIRLGYDKFMIWVCAGLLFGFAIYGLTNHNVIQVTLNHGIRHAMTAFGLLLGLYVFQKSQIYARLVEKAESNIKKDLEKYRKKVAEHKSEMIAKNVKDTRQVIKCVAVLPCWVLGLIADAALPFNDWMITSFVIGGIGSFILLKSKWFATMLENNKRDIENSFEEHALYPE